MTDSNASGPVFRPPSIEEIVSDDAYAQWVAQLSRPLVTSLVKMAVSETREDTNASRDKLNERIVLADPRVRREIERLGFAVYRADWTRRDENIRQALARLGRAGVPAYAIYDPRRPDAPNSLPELLSVKRLLTALRDAAPEGNRVRGVTLSRPRTSMDTRDVASEEHV